MPEILERGGGGGDAAEVGFVEAEKAGWIKTGILEEVALSLSGNPVGR